MFAGAAGIGAAVITAVVALAVVLSTGGGAAIAAAAVGLLLAAGFAGLGARSLRRWLGRSTAVRTERQALLDRHDQLTAALASAAPPRPNRRPAPAPPGTAWPTANDKFRMVVAGIIAALILLSILATRCPASPVRPRRRANISRPVSASAAARHHATWSHAAETLERPPDAAPDDFRSAEGADEMASVMTPAWQRGTDACSANRLSPDCQYTSPA